MERLPQEWVLSDPNSKQRLQEETKKFRCKAQSKVLCKLNNLGQVTLVFKNEHNQDMNTTDGLQYLPMSKDLKGYIIKRLREGFDKRDVRIAVQRSFSAYLSQNLNLSLINRSDDNLSVVHRDKLIHADEIYTIYYEVHNQKYQRDKNQYLSIKIWLKELEDSKTITRLLMVTSLRTSLLGIFLHGKKYCSVEAKVGLLMNTQYHPNR
ncbi:MAG: hypothetical protein EXX96DRAFT_160634 [Benjaminiella poitrasii]|nr:MAG: hypothetical protein EXX96DRAFT_160634 [Benjaminiella poitrasii]